MHTIYMYIGAGFQTPNADHDISEFGREIAAKFLNLAAKFQKFAAKSPRNTLISISRHREICHKIPRKKKGPA